MVGNEVEFPRMMGDELNESLLDVTDGFQDASMETSVEGVSVCTFDDAMIDGGDMEMNAA